MQTLARWSTTHRRTVIVVWLVALIASIGTAGSLKNRFDNNLTLPHTEAQRATDLLRERFPAQAGDVDQVVFRVRGGALTATATKTRIDRALRAVAALPHVTRVVAPFAGERMISRDGRTGFALVSFDERGDALPTAAVKRVITAAERARSPQLEVALGGSAIEETQRPTLGAATLIGIAAAMVVLFVSFGSLLAMGLPIVTALFGVGTSMGLIAALTHVLSTPDFATQLALLIGLGVGVDYALFVVTRYRDALERTAGDVDAAVVEAMNTAGRSVAFAGVTVVIAVLGLFLVGIELLYGVALATSLTVLLVLAASLTLLPALLSLAGSRIGGRTGTRSSAWRRWVGVIQRRPLGAAAVATAALLLLAAPALDLRLASSDAGNDRAGTTTRHAYELLKDGFGAGFNAPLQVAVALPGGGEAHVAALGSAIARTPGVVSVAPPVYNDAHDAAALTIFPASQPQSSQTYGLVKHLRAAVVPSAVAGTGLTAFVGGFTASQVDFARVLSAKLPLFIGVVILVSALFLLVVFRSLVIPLQAAFMNLLAIGASLGVVQAVFERGWGAGVLGVSRSPVEAFIPVIAFAIVFGLSMDYEVFLVSRIHEEWSRSADHEAAVREGLVRTGRVVTAAAAVMVVVFASFAASDNHILKLFGLTLATAVLLDAVVIRSILLPAVLQLAGRATWFFPAWADRRLPRLAIEPSAAAPELEVVEEAA
ncbi:MAG TPA: MMPL family transporter [Gaiellaceae bacterium]|nr:MMPL family transporter [Gaiellaceae bacterium]